MTFRSFPILRILLFFIAGLLVPFLDYSILLLVALLLVCIGSFAFYKKWFSITSLTIWLLIFCFGNAYWAQDRDHKQGFVKYENTEAYLVQISNSPEKKPKSYKAYGNVLSIKMDSLWQPYHAKTLLYFNLAGGIEPIYGETYLIHNKPREIEGVKNPEEFDYKAFQAKKGITTHHFLREGDAELVAQSGGNFLFKFAYRLNDYAKSVFREFIKIPENKAVANAMIIGIKDELDNDLRDTYATAGAVHILAVSGLHVGILFLLLTYTLGWIKRFKYGNAIFGITVIGILWVYALFTGLSPSVSRAALMFTFFQFGSLIGREKNSINTIAISALVLLLFEPSWLYEVGFQLSYLAIFGIVYLYPFLDKLWRPHNYLLRKLWQITAVSICAQLFTFPLSIYYFHQFPNYFLLTNPIVSILSTVILFAGILLLFVAKIPIVGLVFATGFDWSLSLLNYAVKWIEALPVSKSEGFSLEIFEVLMLYALVFCAVLFFQKKHPKYFYLAASLFIAVCSVSIFQKYKQSKQQNLTFHFIPKSSGISLISQNKVTFISEDKTINDDRVYGFHLKNYYDKIGIDKVDFVGMSETESQKTIVFQNQRILWLRKKDYGKVDGEFDKVMISNNAIYDIKKAFPILPKQVILDDSNKSYYTKNVKEQCEELGIEVISLYDVGGVVFPLN